MLLSLSWKNIWRKPSRSIVLVVAIAIGLAGGVFTIALSNGILKQRNENVIEQQLSHIQIHNRDFYNNPKIKDTIADASAIVRFLEKQKDIKTVSSRLKFLGMISSARSSAGVMITGINPEEEKNISTIHDYLLDSTNKYISDKSTNDIVISAKIAQNLMLVFYKFDDKSEDALLKFKFSPDILSKLKPILDKPMRLKSNFKDSLRKYLNSTEYEKFADVITEQSTQYRLNKRIILRFNNSHGDLIEEAFRVIGIYKTQDAMFDNMNVFVNKKFIAQLLDVPRKSATEIAIMTTDISQVQTIANRLSKKFDKVLVQTYMQLDPMSVYQSDFVGIFYDILIAFILFALSFGIVNTVLMSVMERTKEIGMIMSIGMKKSKIFLMIMYESIMISLTGGVLGMILGASVSLYFGKVGIDLSAYSSAMSSFGIDTVMYPSLSMNFFVAITILVVLTGILSAIYPAKKALKLNPAEAIRSDA